MGCSTLVVLLGISIGLYDRYKTAREIQELKSFALRAGLRFSDPIALSSYNAEASPWGFPLRTWNGRTEARPSWEGLRPLKETDPEYLTALSGAGSYFGLRSPEALYSREQSVGNDNMSLLMAEQSGSYFFHFRVNATHTLP